MKVPDRLLNLSGIYLPRRNLHTSVGVFCERLRANTVRPYRVLGKYFVISPLILHAFGEAFCYSLSVFLLYCESCCFSLELSRSISAIFSIISLTILSSAEFSE